MPTIPESITPDQQAERDKLFQEGGENYVRQYFGHIQKLLAAVDKSIEENLLPNSPDDIGFLGALKSRIFQRMQKLGIIPDPPNIAGYQEIEKKDPQDWRE